MPKYLVLYHADASAAEQLARATEAEQQAGMQQWMQWFAKAGDAIIDGGSPLTGGDGTIGGYSILQADSDQALADLLDSHPHLEVGTIETLEFLPMPGI